MFILSYNCHMLSRNSNLLKKNNLEFEKHPFDHIVIDNFFDIDTAENLLGEFPNYDTDIWHEYKNAIELKKTCNDWNKFNTLTYSVFHYLNSDTFLNILKRVFKFDSLYSDMGLNGGGLHIHGSGGKLNPHLDYSVHPKLRLQRKLNLIVYLNKDWKEEYGGQFGMWSASEQNKPETLIKEILPIFNRAVLFDTTQNSWHGLSREVKACKDIFRKSIATYYLCDLPDDADRRGKALFHPTKEQEKDEEVLELIKKRADILTASHVYKKKK